MRRREFVRMMAGAAAYPVFGYAQAANPVIGYLSSKDQRAEAGIVAAVREGLVQQGFIEGGNVSILFRWAAGEYGRLPNLASDLLRRKVNIIAASGLPATLAAKAATTTTPIVFRLAVDPVAFKLTQSFDRPGGNITGVTMLFDPLTPKKLQLLHELLPNVKSIGLLVNPNNENHVSHRDYAARATAALGLQLTVLTVGRAGEMDAAFVAAREKGVGAMLVGDDPLFDVISRRLVDAAARHRMVTMYYVRDFVLMGGLISYGPSFDEMASQVGVYLGRILQGAKPADLPVQQPTKIELVINVRAAKALGHDIPSAMLARADQVID